jgi:hypothetical protein
MEKFLPISVQNFAEMITGNFVYVDKTRYVYEMVRIPQAYYFLSRPRRFGKSLLVSTLKALFEGRKGLFKGLWIESSDWPWKPHPVVTVDFSQVKLTTAATFEESLSSALDQIAAPHAIQLKHNLLANKFVELITEMHKKYREKIVVLVDEYDKPIITHLGEGEAGLQIARQIRAVSKEFFGVLKGADVAAALRLVFITGISKFTKVSIFSELNNLQDLSMRASYAGLLGYTREELERYFSDWIAEFARRQQTTPEEILQLLREWYNGHRFSEDALQVYNPFSVLNALTEHKFKPFWFETATPSFLINLIQERDYPIPNLENLRVQDATFSTYELENLQLEALLFQTGYLTIHDYDGLLYRLGYPNQEVKTAFLNYIYHRLVKIADSTLKAQFVHLHQYLAQDDLAQFIQTTNAILSAIPYTQIGGQDEAYYHTVFYLMLSASGVLVHTEPLSAHGRMDIAVEFKDKVFVVELKCNQSAEAAIRQIHDKRYHDKYAQSGRKIYLLGINFNTKERAITDWRLEALNN